MRELQTSAQEPLASEQALRYDSEVCTYLQSQAKQNKKEKLEIKLILH